MSTNVSVTKQELVNKAVASAIMTTALKCSVAQTVGVKVKLVFDNVNAGDLTFNATAVADISCIQTAEQTADLQTNIANQLKALVEQQATAGPALFSIGVATNVSTQQQNIINDIASNMSITTIQESVASQVVGADVDITASNSVIKNILVSAGASAVLTAVQNNTATAQARTELANTMEATSKQTATTGLAIGAIIAIVIILIIVCCLVRKSSGGGGNVPNNSTPGKPMDTGASSMNSSMASLLSNPQALQALKAGFK